MRTRHECVDAALAPPGGFARLRIDDVMAPLPAARWRRAVPYHPFHGLGGLFTAQNIYLLRKMSRRRPHFVGKRSDHLLTTSQLLSDSTDDLLAILSRLGPNSKHEILPPLHQTPSVVRFRRDTLSSTQLDEKHLTPHKTKHLSPFLVGKRAPPSFIGKRLEADDKRARLFVGRRSDDADEEDSLEKRARLFVGKKSADEDKRARMFVGKRPRMFVGKREDEENEKRARMFVGKRARMFVGKRPRMFVGKRDDEESELDEKRNRMFVGKRPYMDDEDQKRARMFVGKRARMFVGKRSDDDDAEDEKRAHMFVGKRSHEDAYEKRARMFVGKRPRMFVGKKSDEFDDEEAREEEKRNRMFVGKRARMFVGRRSDFDDEKRARMFVGKRADDISEDKRARMFVGRSIPLQDYYDHLKRAHFFVGKRNNDEDDTDLNDNDMEKRARLFVGKRRVPGFVGKRPAPGFIGKRAVPDEAEIVKRSLNSPAETVDQTVDLLKTAVKSKRDTSSVAKDSQGVRGSSRDN